MGELEGIDLRHARTMVERNGNGKPLAAVRSKCHRRSQGGSMLRLALFALPVSLLAVPASAQIAGTMETKSYTKNPTEN